MSIINKNDIFEKNIAEGFINDIKKSNEELNKLIESSKQLLSTLSGKLSFFDEKDLQSINSFVSGFKKFKSETKALEAAQKQLAAQTQMLIKIEQEKEKLNQQRVKTSNELEKVNTQAKKTAQEAAKARIQESKIEQENLKLVRQQISTRRAEAAERERQQKSREKAERLLRLENSAYEQQKKELNDIKRALKDLSVVGGVDPTLQKRFEELDKSVRKAEQSVGEFQREVGNYPQLINEVSVSFKDLVKNLGPAALAIAGVQAAIEGIGSAIAEVQQINNELAQTATVTGLSGKELDEFTGKARNLAEVYGKDYNEVLIAANTFSKEFGISQTDALNQITNGFIRGADTSGDFLTKVKEYPAQFRQAGLAAEDFINVATTEVAAGVFDDKLLDTIKEAGLRLRELPKSTEDALASLFKSQTVEGKKAFDAFTKGLKDGTLSTKDALIQVKNQISQTTPDVKTLQTLTADLLGGPGEDIGGAKQALELFEQAINSTNQELTDFQKTQQEQLKVSEELQKSQIEFAKNLKPIIDFFVNLGKVILTGVLNAFNFLVDVFTRLPEIIRENIVLISALGVALTTVFSSQIVSRVQKLSSAVFDLGKRLLRSSIITKALSVAQTAYSTVTGLLSGKIKIATIAQKAFNTAAKANPIGLVITAVTALIGVLAILANSYETVAESQAKLNEENKKFAENSKKRSDEAIANIDREEKRLQSLGATNEKITEDRLKNIDKAQKTFRRSIPVIAREIEDLEKKQKAYNSLLDDFRKKSSSSTEDAIPAWKRYTGVVDLAGLSAEEAQKAIDEVNKGLAEQRKALKDAQRADEDLSTRRLETLREIKNNEKKAAEEAKAREKKDQAERLKQYIDFLSEQIAATKRRVAATKRENEDETDFLEKSLEDRIKLIDLEAKRTIASQKNIGVQARKLLLEQAKDQKEALRKELSENVFEGLLQDTNELFDEQLRQLRRDSSNRVITQKEFAQESIKVEIDRLKALIKLRKDAGEDVSEQEARLAENERDLREKRTEDSINELQKQKNEELKEGELFFRQRAKDLDEENAKELEAGRDLLDVQKENSELKQAERIAQLEEELAIIERFKQEREDLEKEAGEEDVLLQQEIAEKNEELLKADLERQLEIEEELAALKLQQQIQANQSQLQERQKFFEAANQLADAFAQREIERSNQRIERLDNEIDSRQNNVDRLQEIAQDQNINAAEQIAFEERKISAAKRRQQKEQERQRIIEAALAAFKTYSAELEAGKKPGQALADTIKNVTLLSSLVQTLPSFDKGTELFKPGENVDGKGGALAILHKNEGVIREDYNLRRLKTGTSIPEMIEITEAVKGGMSLPSVNTEVLGKIEMKAANSHDPVLLSEIRRLSDKMGSFTAVKNGELDQMTNIIRMVVKDFNGFEEVKYIRPKKWKNNGSK